MKLVILELLVLVCASIIFVNYYSLTGFFSLETSPESKGADRLVGQESQAKTNFDYFVSEVKKSDKDLDKAEGIDQQPAQNGFQTNTLDETLDYVQEPEQSQGFIPSPVITEVEPNPEGNDAGNEWVELFYSEDIDFVGDYYLENSNGKRFNLTGSYTGFFTITFPTQWINNANEKIYLKYYDGTVLSETPVMNDSGNNASTWNMCIGGWAMNYGSQGTWNNCTKTCEADLDYNWKVDGADLGMLLGFWGWMDNGYSDLTGDGRINETDTDFLLSKWGSCN